MQKLYDINEKFKTIFIIIGQIYNHINNQKYSNYVSNNMFEYCILRNAEII